MHVYGNARRRASKRDYRYYARDRVIRAVSANYQLPPDAAPLRTLHGRRNAIKERRSLLDTSTPHERLASFGLCRSRSLQHASGMARDPSIVPLDGISMYHTTRSKMFKAFPAPPRVDAIYSVALACKLASSSWRSMAVVSSSIEKIHFLPSTSSARFCWISASVIMPRGSCERSPLTKGRLS